MPVDYENTVQVRAHRATLLASEQTRQAAMAAAKAVFLAGGAGAAAAYALAVKNSDIAHFRRVILSAQANGVPVPGPAIEGLFELGAGPHP